MQRNAPAREWRLASVRRPLVAFGAAMLRVNDTADLVHVRPFLGPYDSACPEFYQDARGLVIHADNLEFVEAHR